MSLANACLLAEEKMYGRGRTRSTTQPYPAGWFNDYRPKDPESAPAAAAGPEPPEFPTTLAEAIRKFNQLAVFNNGQCAPINVSNVFRRAVGSGCGPCTVFTSPAARVRTALVITDEVTAGACIDLVDRGRAQGIVVPYIRFSVLAHGDLPLDDPDCLKKAEIVARLARELFEQISRNPGNLFLLHCQQGRNRSTAVFLAFFLHFCKNLEDLKPDQIDAELRTLVGKGFRPASVVKFAPPGQKKKLVWYARRHRATWYVVVIAAFYLLKRQAALRPRIAPADED